MASAADDSDLPPIPSLPPLVGIDGRRYEDVVPQLFPGQNSPPAAVGLSENTPPPFRINAACSDQPSAMSSLTATYDVSTPAVSRTRCREKILVPLGGGDSVSGGGGSAKRGGGAQRAGSSAVAAARMLWRWRQRDSVTSAAAWRRCGGIGGSAAALLARRWRRR